MTDSESLPPPPTTETPPPGPALSGQVGQPAGPARTSRWPVVIVIGLGCLLPVVGVVALTALAFFFYVQVPASEPASAPTVIATSPGAVEGWRPAGPQAAGVNSWGYSTSGSTFFGTPADFQDALNKALFDSPWATTNESAIGTFRDCDLSVTLRGTSATVIVEMGGDRGRVSAVFTGTCDRAGKWTFVPKGTTPGASGSSGPATGGASP